MTPTTGSDGSVASPTAATGKGRDIWLKLRVNDSERDQLAAAASAAGLSTANYLRERLGLDLEGRARAGHAKRGKKKQQPENAPVNSQSHSEETAGKVVVKLGMVPLPDDHWDRETVGMVRRKFPNHTADAPVLGKLVPADEGYVLIGIDPGAGDERVALCSPDAESAGKTIDHLVQLVATEPAPVSFAALVNRRKGR